MDGRETRSAALIVAFVSLELHGRYKKLWPYGGMCVTRAPSTITNRHQPSLSTNASARMIAHPQHNGVAIRADIAVWTRRSKHSLVHVSNPQVASR